MQRHELADALELKTLQSSGEKSTNVRDDDVISFSDADEVLLSDVEYTKAEEDVIIKKLDFRVAGLVAGLYMLSFLDRSNIGNAKIAGMMSGLNLTGSQYEWLLTAFYITYISFQFMPLLFKLCPARIYLSVVVLTWGLIASSQALATSFTAMLVARVALGFSEAAFTGVPFYMSFFYKREELAFRTGIFIAAAPLATTFASSLAWLITWIGQWIDIIAPWRLLFLVEGFPSILVAYYCWTHVADSPGTAWFFTPREQGIATARLETSGNLGIDQKATAVHNASRLSASLHLSEVMETFKDPKSYFKAAILFSANVAFSSMPVFLPTIITEMGYDAMSAQALSAPPYLVSFVTVLIVAYFSDIKRSRSSFIIGMGLLAAAGYLTSLTAGLLGLPNWIRYLALYPACMGFFSCVTLVITWTLNNQESETKKGVGIAILQFIGQCGPLLGTRLYPAKDGPLYVRGMAACAGFMCLVALLAFSLRLLLARENARRLSLAMLHDLDEEVEDARLLDGGPSRRPKKTAFLFIL